MTKRSRKFAELLSAAVQAIAKREYKTMASVQDELGYALGRETGGSSVDYWRRGYVPAYLEDLEKLTHLLVERQGLNQTECEQFLHAGDYPYPEKLLGKLFSHRPPQPPVDFSYFVVGPPIVRLSQFFGREDELTRIFRAWSRLPLEHFAIIGLRRSGKTSLLHYLKNITRAVQTELRAGQRTDYLPQPERFRWVLVNFQDPRRRRQESLFRYLLSELNLPMPDLCDQDNFLDVVSRHLQTPTVILMDELQAGLAAEELDEDFWWGLRAASQDTNGNLAYVLTASVLPFELAKSQNKPSPFFNIFHTIELGPFKDSEARELIASSPIPINSTEVEWMLEQSGCWPCLLQILCQTCLIALEAGQIDPDWRAKGFREMAQFSYLLDKGLDGQDE